MPGFYGSNKHSGAVWPGLNCSLQNRIQTESWGTRPAILFKLIGPDTDEKLLHGKHLETRYTGIRIKAVCIYSDFVCFSINFLKHACRHPEKCLCVATRNSLMCEQVSFEWEILDKQIISYLSSFPPCRAPACGSRPRAWPCPPPWRSLSQLLTTGHSPQMALVSVSHHWGLWLADNGVLTWSTHCLHGPAQDIKISLLTSALLPAAGHGIGLDKHYSFKVQFTFIEPSIMVTFSLDLVAAFVWFVYLLNNSHILVSLSHEEVIMFEALIVFLASSLVQEWFWSF